MIDMEKLSEYLRIGSEEVAFWIEGNPPKTTHHSKRITARFGKGGRRFGGMRDSDKLVEAKAWIDTKLAKHRVPEPIQGPVSLQLIWVFEWPRSTPKKLLTKVRWRQTKPDCSNLAKTLEDRLVANGFLKDDNCVVMAQQCKVHGPNPGIYVKIRRVGSVEAEASRP